jgi:hypothetical protein
MVLAILLKDSQLLNDHFFTINVSIHPLRNNNASENTAKPITY